MVYILTTLHSSASKQLPLFGFSMFKRHTLYFALVAKLMCVRYIAATLGMLSKIMIFYINETWGVFVCKIRTFALILSSTIYKLEFVYKNEE